MHKDSVPIPKRVKPRISVATLGLERKPLINNLLSFVQGSNRDSNSEALKEDLCCLRPSGAARSEFMSAGRLDSADPNLVPETCTCYPKKSPCLQLDMWLERHTEPCVPSRAL